jgi:exopolysaccharide biosynthesis polyprenyl glycosylphosphotransferase
MKALSTSEPPSAEGRIGSMMDGEDLLTPSGSSRVRAIRSAPTRWLPPLVAAALVAALADAWIEGAVLGFLTFGVAFFVGPQRGTWAKMLPLMRSPLHATRPLLGMGVLAVVQLVTDAPGLNFLELVAVAIAATAVSVIPSLFVPQAWAPDRAIRIAILGSTRTAIELARELRLEDVPEYIVVGRIEAEPNGGDRSGEMPTLGHLNELAEIVARHDIRLLVFSSEVPRFALFREVADTCLDLPVRMWELSSFYEEVFGHVPVAEINPSWFQYIMHPKYRAVAPRSKRTLDIMVALPIGLLSLPLLAVVALIIRRDGGPVFFRQKRIGEGGRPITLIKLRTMKVESGEEAQWAAADDPRVTTIGRLLRRTHLDEFPQIINVLRGEMSLVGPRPEQPEFVERLEELIPFYARRHLIKPGITGWAQVRCGYAGSDTGSAWKLSHDLYYLKHRSMSFDIAILCETIRTFFADRQHAVAPMNLSFVRSDPLAVETTRALNG